MLRSARSWPRGHGEGPAPPEGVRYRGQVLPPAAAQSRRAAADHGARGAAAPAAHRPLPAGTGGRRGPRSLPGTISCAPVPPCSRPCSQGHGWCLYTPVLVFACREDAGIPETRDGKLTFAQPAMVAYLNKETDHGAQLC